jgi:hypothetical protein
MSWNFEFLARDKAAALNKLRRQEIPVSIQGVIETAINNIPVHNQHPILVASSGHIADGDFVATSTDAKISVRCVEM